MHSSVNESIPYATGELMVLLEAVFQLNKRLLLAKEIGALIG
jgi:hypothetical protein